MVRALALAVGGIVTLSALAIIPISHSFSDGFNATSIYGGVAFEAPSASRLTVARSSHGSPVSILISNGQGTTLDATSAANGTFAFTSTTPSDGFGARSPGSAYILLEWTYTAPIL